MVMNGDIMEYLIKKVFYAKLNLKYECSIVYNGCKYIVVLMQYICCYALVPTY